MKYNLPERGFTLFEVLVATALMALMMFIAVSNLKELNRPLLNSTAQVSSFIKQTRAKALTTTAAYEVYPESETVLRARFAATCDAASFEDDEQLVLNLPNGSSLEGIEWSVCFTSRGMASDNITITLRDEELQERDIEILLGGSVRIL